MFKEFDRNRVFKSTLEFQRIKTIICLAAEGPSFREICADIPEDLDVIHTTVADLSVTVCHPRQSGRTMIIFADDEPSFPPLSEFQSAFDCLQAGDVLAVWNSGRRPGLANTGDAGVNQSVYIPLDYSDFVSDRSLDFIHSGPLSLLYKPSETLRHFKDKHKGERLFVVGNGPSLNRTNLNLMRGFQSIAMNRISLIYPRTSWRPTYYLFCSSNVRDERWGEDWIESVNAAIDEQPVSAFIWERFADVVKARDKITEIRSMSEMEIGTCGTFSRNADQHISKTGTTMNAAFQLAYYMGFSQIIILGADLNWVTGGDKGDDHNHFDSNYRAQIPDGLRERIRMRRTHEVAKSVFNAAGIEVINATPETFLDIYPMADLKEIAGDQNWKCPRDPSGNLTDSPSPRVQERRKTVSEFWRNIDLS